MTGGDAAQTASMINPSAKGDGLAIAFGATTVMWLVLYVTCMPAVAAHPIFVAALVAACLFGAGVFAGKAAGRSWRGGALLGISITAVNLIMLTSLGQGEDRASILLSTLQFILAFLAISVLLCAIGAAIGSRLRHGEDREHVPANWTGRFALVIALLTLMLLQAGGIVTTLEAGMAVPGWLMTFDYPMMFYPLALMQQDGGVFAEHFHRLWGLLVGLGMIVLTVHLWRVEDRERRWVAWMSTAILLAVIIQGVLGGTRVTENNLALAIIHGVFGQLIFAAIACVAVVTAARWRCGNPLHRETARFDRSHSTMLFCILIAQLVLGALYRHLQVDPDMSKGVLHSIIALHILGAIAVLALSIVVGMRAWGKYGVDEPILARYGKTLLIIPAAQFALGFAAFMVVPGETRPAGETVPLAEVVIATAHQVVGSILLAISAALMLWMRRLITPATPPQPLAA